MSWKDYNLEKGDFSNRMLFVIEALRLAIVERAAQLQVKINPLLLVKVSNQSSLYEFFQAYQNLMSALIPLFYTSINGVPYTEATMLLAIGDAKRYQYPYLGSIYMLWGLQQWKMLNKMIYAPMPFKINPAFQRYGASANNETSRYNAMLAAYNSMISKPWTQGNSPMGYILNNTFVNYGTGIGWYCELYEYKFEFTAVNNTKTPIIANYSMLIYPYYSPYLSHADLVPIEGVTNGTLTGTITVDPFSTKSITINGNPIWNLNQTGEYSRTVGDKPVFSNSPIMEYQFEFRL